MKKIITLILALLMAFSVVISGCTVTNNGGNDNGGNNPSGPSQPDNPDNPSDPGDSDDDQANIQYSTIKDSKGRYVYEKGVTYSEEIGNYDPDIKTEQESESIYNKDVFYSNDIVISCADPEVMYISDPTSPYYDNYIMYGTTGNGVYNAFSSKDLVSWNGVSGAYTWPDGGWQETATWAPGVIWDQYADREMYGLNPSDPGTGVYFIFCSAQPDAIWDIQTDRGGTSQLYILDCAVSTSPAGPYVPALTPELGATVNGVDYSTALNFSKFTVYEGYNLSNETVQLSGGRTVGVGRYGDTRTANDIWWNFSAARASLKWQWANRDKVGQNVGGRVVPQGAAFMDIDEGSSNFTCIDPTPFLNYQEMYTKTATINGVTKTWQEPTKYLFFTRDGNGLYGTNDPATGFPIFCGTCVYAVKFYNNEWSQPDYSTLTRITRTRMNMISQEAADYYNQQAAAYVPSNYPANQPKETAKATLKYATVESRIKSNNGINEGAQLYYNKQNGMYYLTISMGSYTDTTYCLLQLVAYDVLGPYRKLDVGEGGLLLGTDAGRVTDVITGPGHHTFMEVYDHPTETDSDPTNDKPRELAVVYHRHVNLSYSKFNRGPVVDVAKWVRNNNGMLVMHANGPTTFLQPRIYATGETPYYNIATDDGVVIKVENPTGGVAQGNDIKYLTDGIIPIYSDVSTATLPALESYVHEYSSSESTGIAVTITFPTYRKVRALMIYNSKDYDKAFSSVRNVEFDVRRGDWSATAIITRLNFDWAWNQQYGVRLMRPGGSAVALFQEIEMKEIRFMVVRSSGMSAINIPEIVVLGRPNGQ